jgi:hypothetical protein
VSVTLLAEADAETDAETETEDLHTTPLLIKRAPRLTMSKL